MQGASLRAGCVALALVGPEPPSLPYRASLTLCKMHFALLWTSLEESESGPRVVLMRKDLGPLPHPWEGATSTREQWPHRGQLLGSCYASKTPLTPPFPGPPRYNSAKKDNDFIYHEAVPALDTLQPVKGLTLGGGWGSGWRYRGHRADVRSAWACSPQLLSPRCPLGEALASEPHRPSCHGP